MNDYIIVTDSTADLPFELYKQLGIKVVPMEFSMEERGYKHYEDCREMSLQEFYKHIRDGKKITTTQINHYIYESVFKPILDKGKDILYLCFSSGLSGTYQVSRTVSEDMRKKYPERRIVSVDTLCASVGEGLLVHYAANLKIEGKGLDEVLDWVEKNKLKIAHWIVVDDLDHLKQGGRINALQANLGTALNLKPIISIDNEGKLIPVSKQRGTKRATDELIKRMKSDGVNLKNQTVIIGHADNIEYANFLYDRIKELSIVKEIIVSYVGPIIGTHVGSGMIGLTFIGRRNFNK